MTGVSRSGIARVCYMASCLLMGWQSAMAADSQPRSQVPVVVPAPANDWTFRFVPYAWLPWMKGHQTIKGRRADLDLHIFDVIEKSDSLIGWMSAFELRKGPMSLYGDVIWSKVGISGSVIRSNTIANIATITAGASVEANVEQTTIEVGGSYEVASWSLGGGALALDVLAGARYWRQQADVSVNVGAALNIANLTIARGRAIARSGAVDWTDPVVGLRLRHQLAPGHEVFLRGDVGGFGVGSKTSWQGIAGYSYDIATKGGITYSGIVGYRALYVDYSRGIGSNRYEFDLLQHGPILGLGMRF